MAQIKGIDISHWQGWINWDKVANDGIRFAYMKASERNTFTDKRYRDNARRAAQAGIPFGAYHFARPNKSSASAAAAHHLKVTASAGIDPDLPHCLDIETRPGFYDDGFSRSRRTDWCLEWLRHVELATGRTPILYMSKSYPADRLDIDSAELARHRLWVAAWRSTDPGAPRPWSKWHLWQFTDKGHVSGIAGNVDLNWSTEANLAELLGRLAAPAASVSVGALDRALELQRQSRAELLAYKRTLEGK